MNQKYILTLTAEERAFLKELIAKGRTQRYHIRHAQILLKLDAQILYYIQQANGEYAIPPKSNTVKPWLRDWHAYKDCHVIEYFFKKLKLFRRVSTRYDKCNGAFLVSSILILLK